MGWDTEPTTKPDVLDLRVLQAQAMPDATVLVRFDGPSTSFTYVLRHVAIDASNARPWDGEVNSSKPIAVELPKTAGIVDGVFGVLDGGPSNAFTCRPSLYGIDGPSLYVADYHSKAAPRAVSDVEDVLKPTIGALAPLQCGKAMESARVDGDPVQPEYPFAAGALERTGIAVIRITVRADGTAHDAIVERSSGTKDLDVAGIVAALRTRYVPKRFRCAPAPGEYLFKARFSAGLL